MSTRSALAAELESMGKTRAEIATLLGVPQKHVGKYLAYAKAPKRVTSPKGCTPKREPQVIGECPSKHCGLRIFDDGRPHLCMAGIEEYVRSGQEAA